MDIERLSRRDFVKLIPALIGAGIGGTALIKLAQAESKFRPEQKLKETETIPEVSIYGQIEVDPQNPEHFFVLAGPLADWPEGEIKLYRSFYNPSKHTIEKWEVVSENPLPLYNGTLSLSPIDSNIILAAGLDKLFTGQGEVHLSTNGGKTFNKILEKHANFTDSVFTPDGQYSFLSSSYNPSLFKVDILAHQEIPLSLNGLTTEGLPSVHLSPNNPQRIHAPANLEFGYFYSSDGGENFSHLHPETTGLYGFEVVSVQGKDWVICNRNRAGTGGNTEKPQIFIFKEDGETVIINFSSLLPDTSFWDGYSLVADTEGEEPMIYLGGCQDTGGIKQPFVLYGPASGLEGWQLMTTEGLPPTGELLWKGLKGPFNFSDGEKALFVYIKDQGLYLSPNLNQMPPVGSWEQVSNGLAGWYGPNSLKYKLYLPLILKEY